MKCLAVMAIALFVLVAAEEEWSPIIEKSTLQKMHADCQKESGTTPDQLEKMRNFDLPDKKEVRAYARCIGKQFGTFTDDKGYDFDRLMAQFTIIIADVEQIRHILTGCIDSNEQKSPPDEWAYRGQKCIMDSKIGDILKESNKKA